MADCGIPQGIKDIQSLAATAEETIAGLQEDALASLNSQLNAASESVLGKLQETIKLPEPPALTLQGEIQGLLDAADSPGEMIQKYKSLTENFPGVDTKGLLGSIGVDSTAIDKALNIDTTGVLNELGIDANSIEGAAQSALDLVNNGLPTPEKILETVGGFLPPFETDVQALKDKVCSQIPNIKIDEAGNAIKEGLESLQPTEIAEQVQPAAKNVAAPVVEKVNQTQKKVEEKAVNIVTRKMTPEEAEVNKRIRDRINNEKKPLLAEVRELNNLAEETGQAIVAERANALRHHIKMLEKDIRYDSRKAKYDLGLTIIVPVKWQLSDYDFKFYYAKHQDIGEKTKALQFIEFVE